MLKDVAVVVVVGAVLLQMFLIYFKTSSLASVFIGHNRTLITHNGSDVVANLTLFAKDGR